MSAVAVGYLSDLVNEQVVRSHPVPKGRSVDDSRSLLKRSACISVALHLLLALVAAILNYWPTSGITGTPQEEIMNVTIVPLSAFDTLLPKGSPQEAPVAPEQPKKAEEIKDTAVAKVKSEPLKKIVPLRSPALSKSKPAQTDVADSSSSASTQAAVQPLGVAHGEAISLEQARISYQDMVATLLARAKRYPERALKRRMTGEGTIRIEISADGSLSRFQIVRSTELPILDEELRAMVSRAAPFPAFPSDLSKSSLALVVPVAFKLQS